MISSTSRPFLAVSTACTGSRLDVAAAQLKAIGAQVDGEVGDRLTRWSSPGHPVAESSSELAGGPEEVTSGPVFQPVLDQHRLDALRDLGDLNGVNLVDKVIDLVSRDSATSLTAIRKAVQNNDEHDLEESAHKLKGSAANLGAQRIATLCQQLEAEAATLSTQQSTDLVDQLDAELHLVLSALNHNTLHITTPLTAAAPSTPR